MLKFIYDNREVKLRELTDTEYELTFLADEKKGQAAFERAWSTRNFEIELYWKRANYFWAFIASTLVGYFALTNADNYRKPDPLNHVEVYFVVCIGFVLASAWFFINLGSKAWQRNWETHIDLLEDKFTGPLYKSAQPRVTYSVSKINEIVSFSFIVLWVLLGVKYLIENNILNYTAYRINWLVVISSAAAILALISMIFGHGRGRFSNKGVSIFRRETEILHRSASVSTVKPSDKSAMGPGDA